MPTRYRMNGVLFLFMGIFIWVLCRGVNGKEKKNRHGKGNGKGLAKGPSFNLKGGSVQVPVASLIETNSLSVHSESTANGMERANKDLKDRRSSQSEAGQRRDGGCPAGTSSLGYVSLARAVG